MFVEGDPFNFEELKKNREHAINIHGGLCSELRSLHYASDSGQATRGFVELMTPEFKKLWHPKLVENPALVNDLPIVQCLPMKLLLEALNVKHVDLWVLDVEGAEESVLLGTDFDAVKIDVIAMECNDFNAAEYDRKKLDILAKHGYECTRWKHNCMCKHKDFVIHTRQWITIHERKRCH